MGEKLKVTRQEIESLILDLDTHEEAYKNYLTLNQNGLTLCWLFFLSIPAILGVFYPEYENYLLIGLLVGSLICFKLLPRINSMIINLYLRKINKNLGHQVLVYKKYHRLIRKNIVETLQEGSDNNYLQKVIIKTLAQI